MYICKQIVLQLKLQSKRNFALNFHLENKIDASKMTKCQRDRHDDLLSTHVDKFVVKCDANGAYEPLQCWNSVGLCWCVRTKDGSEIFGSRTYFPNKPRCNVLGKDVNFKIFIK